MKPIRVLSLFDGMSCGQIALERAGIPVEVYYACEIKDHAIRVTQAHYPNTVQLGSVTDLDPTTLGHIDLVIGGSPCQDFSQAHKERKGLDGTKSGLFWEYIRILDTCAKMNPDVMFLLENVRMKPEHQGIVDEAMGCMPTTINSSAFSAQIRTRLYWTNIKISSFSDKGITLQSILENGYTDRKKSRALLESDSRPQANPVKKFHRYQKFLTLVFKDKEHYDACKAHYDSNFKGMKAVDINPADLKPYEGLRYLSRRERERLQNVPEGYTDMLSENEAACILGDGWTVDVVAHIFKGIPEGATFQKRIG